ncbi:YqaJ viral recombinase family protein [Cellulosimicrobium cellulans]|uniref:YqaJ viral recombinase family protein n=1 Tax=Cellulosimicrobium cellulans TaxID=1710 RepID=UPI001962ED6B|nr:YqaJ viral recombinase family protein [Cellulosimicrobium cellulans]MBN0040189.1 YqaJ viral recombinase family protein [Cellulosimicrobium cellulans]
MSTASVETLEPGSAPWLRTITASKLAAILGHSPWASPLSTWQQMKGLDPGEPQTAAQSRGHYHEPGVLAWWKDQHPEYTIHRDKVVLRRRGLPWAAATPELVVEGPGQPIAGVEAKTAADTRGAWGKPGTDEIPIYYAVQAMWQMHLGGYEKTFVPVLGEYLTHSEYVVEYDPILGMQFELAAFEFWESLQDDVPPDLDDHPATLESLRRTYREIDRDDAIYLDHATAADIIDAVRSEKAATARLTGAKSRLAADMGKARTAYVVIDDTPVPIASRVASSTGKPYVKFAKTLPTIPKD